MKFLCYNFYFGPAFEMVCEQTQKILMHWHYEEYEHFVIGLGRNNSSTHSNHCEVHALASFYVFIFWFCGSVGIGSRDDRHDAIAI